MSQYAVPVVWSPETRRHDPRHEVWVGVADRGHRDAPTGWTRSSTRCAPTATSWWRRRRSRTTRCWRSTSRSCSSSCAPRPTAGPTGPYRDLVGQERVVPYLFPTPAMTAGLPARPAVAVHADAGRFAYDTMTLVGPGTWEAARAAVDCAVQAAGLVSDGAPAGLRALPPARPPRDARAASAAPATSTTRRSPRPRCAASERSGSASSTSTPTRATAPRRSSTTAPTCSTARCTSTRRPAGSRTSSGTPTRPASVRARAPPATCRCPRAPATSRGWPRSPSSPTGSPAPAATTWSSRSAWTPPPTTRRARCRSPRTATARPGRLLGATGLPAVAVQEGGYHLPTLGGLVAAYLDGHASA